MPEQAGTWLWNTACPKALRRKWVDYWPGPGSDRRQRAGAGRFRIAPIRLCNRRSSSSGTRCGSSGPHADRVTNQARLAKLREG